MANQTKGPGGKRPGAGRKPSYPAGRRDLYARLPTPLFDAFSEAATEQNRSKNDLLIEVLERWLRQRGWKR